VLQAAHGAPLCEARSALELAALREARGRGGDAAAARELRARAEGLAREHGRSWGLGTLAAAALR